MRIANTINDSIVDGPGLRYTVFTQGCPHGCPDCHNPETHDPKGGTEQTVKTLSAGLQNPLIQGLTLSGGEPFLQGVDCAALAVLAHKKGLDVWTYTGYTYEELRQSPNPHWTALLLASDVLVDGTYMATQRSHELIFRGSNNQRLIDVVASIATGSVVLWTRRNNLSHFTVPES